MTEKVENVNAGKLVHNVASRQTRVNNIRDAWFKSMFNICLCEV